MVRVPSWGGYRLARVPLFVFQISLIISNYCFYLQGAIPKRPQPAPSSVACKHLKGLAQWSLGRFVGGEQVNIGTKKFSKTLALSFAKRMDPAKLLFTRSEVQSLVKRANAGWKEIAQKKQCHIFTHWVEQRLPKARFRLEETLKTMKWTLPPSVQKRKQAPETPMSTPKYKNFAKNERVLKKRLREVTDVLVKNAYPALLATYQYNLHLYVQDSLRQMLKRDNAVTELLAKALLRSMDEYSTFFSPSEYKEFNDDLAGGTEGIGVRVRTTPNGLLIDKIMEDSPVQKNGKIEAGDIIVKIDGQNLTGVATSEAKQLLKGEAGTSVNLELERHRKTHKIRYQARLKRKRFSFEEATIHHTLTHAEKSQAPIGIIELPSFYGRSHPNPLPKEKSSAEDFEKALVALKKKNPSAIVLDLRNNPGGYLEEAVSIAGMFMGNRPVVGVQERSHHRIIRNDVQQPIYGGPLVVLLDDESASASEVLAGALKDNNRAVLVGDPTTYGKGTVQRLFHLENEFPLLVGFERTPGKGIVKLTTSIFYSPLGHSPANGGVETDIHVQKKDKKKTTKHSKDHIAHFALDVAPFVSSEELKKINTQSKPHKKLVSALRKASTQRMKAKTKPAAASKKEKAEDSVLSEAIEIASHYASLQKQSKQTALAE